jgi:hypothetical protein
VLIAVTTGLIPGQRWGDREVVLRFSAGRGDIREKLSISDSAILDPLKMECNEHE